MPTRSPRGSRPPAGLPSVILRPSHVYGAGGGYAAELVKRLHAPGRLVVIGSGRNWWDVVRVEDVASACMDAAERAPAGAQLQCPHQAGAGLGAEVPVGPAGRARRGRAPARLTRSPNLAA